MLASVQGELYTVYRETKTLFHVTVCGSRRDVFLDVAIIEHMRPHSSKEKLFAMHNQVIFGIDMPTLAV